MAKTRHFHQRMGQRGVTQRMVELVCDYGVVSDDKMILDRGNIDELLRCMDRLRHDLLKMRDKGGLVVVESNGSKITAYRADSFDRRRAANDGA